MLSRLTRTSILCSLRTQRPSNAQIAKILTLKARFATSSKQSRQNQHYYGYQPPRNRTLSRVLLTLGTLSICGAAAWWFYWPHHTFTSSVAKILRKALHAEIDKAGPDYQTALKYYLEALKQADTEGLDPTSDEYTGIQLKVGEMYERLHMVQDAIMIYSEIASMYIAQLTTPGKVKDPQLRGHLIQKDLRVVIKIVELNQANAHASKMLLMTHFIIAQEEVSRRSKTAKTLIDDENVQLVKNGTHTETDITDDSVSFNSAGAVVKDKSAWLPFRDELFNARDLYVAICLATGDLSSAIRAKIATTTWMLNADCDPGEILMSQTNLGSIMYLQAEEFETKELNSIKSQQDESLVEEHKSAKEKCIRLAEQCYEAVLDFSKKLPANLRRDENVEESIALSTYGLGVINLHMGKLDSAKSLLREARLRAKGSGFTELVSEAERELERLQKEFDERGNDMDADEETDRIQRLLKHSEQQPDIELDIQFVKHK